jgi:superfamily I DNA/RNA helicase
MKEAMKLGILITIFATTLYAVLWAIINYFFIPDFADRFADHTIEYNRYLGKSPETMRKKIIEMNEYRVNYKKPIVIINDNDKNASKTYENKLCLATIHKIKGCEWNYVFLIDLDAVERA